MNMTARVLILGLLPLAMACAPISQQAKMDIARPVDCATAQQDMKVQNSEKASVVKQLADGVTAVQPAGAVIGILTMTEADKLQVAIGEYNHRINRKIFEIQQTCGIQ
jgi:hypothetical protein